MKTINEAVQTIQQQGLANSETEFNLIFNTLQRTTEQRVNNYLGRKFPLMPLDRENIITYCLYEWLERVIKGFDPQKGDFVPFYFATLQKGVQNAVQPQLTNRNQIHFTTLSLDFEDEESEGTILDTLVMVEPEEDFTTNMEDLLNLFAEQRGELARQVVLAHAHYEGSQLTDAICEALGVTEYNATIRQQVSRWKKYFAKLVQVSQ